MTVIGVVIVEAGRLGATISTQDNLALAVSAQWTEFLLVQTVKYRPVWRYWI